MYPLYTLHVYTVYIITLTYKLLIVQNQARLHGGAV